MGCRQIKERFILEWLGALGADKSVRKGKGDKGLGGVWTELNTVAEVISLSLHPTKPHVWHLSSDL